MRCQFFSPSFVTVGLLLAGCGARDSAAPPVAQPAPAAGEPAKATTPAPSPSAAKPQPVPTAKAAAPPSEREFFKQLLESDGHGGWRKNEQAATELEKLRPEQVRGLWALLSDDDAAVRRGASVHLLPLFDPQSRQQVLAFTGALDDSDPMVRARAIDAVRQFSKADQLATLLKLTPLLDAQREDRAENRTAVARLLGSLKREAQMAVAALTDAARYDADARVRAVALAAAVAVEVNPKVLQALRQGLTDKEPSVRLVSASRCRQLGETAAPLAPDLAKALSDPSEGVAENAAEALIAIGRIAVEPLAEQLAGGNLPARKLALAALATLGPIAQTAAPAVEKCRQDADPQVRQLAAAALKHMTSK